MNRWLWSIFGILLMLLVAGGCAKSHVVRTEARPSFFEASVRSNAHTKQAVFAPLDDAENPLLQQAGHRFADSLIGAVRGRAAGLVLHSPAELGYPAFMAGSGPLFANPGQTFILAESARLQGFHYLLDAVVLDVRVTERRTGVRWFRKMRYFMTVAVRLDVYDTFTAAKILCQVEEETIRIDENTYTAFHSGAPYGTADLDATLDGMARKLGRHAVRAMMALPFKASVAGADGAGVALTAGRGVGLRVGDRWDVYEAQRTIQGPAGERFVIPGYRLGTVHITEVAERSAEARVDGGADVRVGDFAIPAQ